jgi:hypothetical protein
MADRMVTGAGHQLDRFECRLPPNLMSLAPLRAAFGTWLGDEATDPGHRQDAVLVMSELAGATLDASRQATAPLRARAFRDAAGISIEVRDDDDGAWDMRVRSLDHDAGRGLAVVATVADVFARRAADDGGKALIARINWRRPAAEPVSR